MSDPRADAFRSARHELANCLAPLLAETQLLLGGDTPLDAEARRVLEEIEQLALRMRTILKQSQQADADR